MKFTALGQANPLNCDKCINLGNYFQDNLSNCSNLVLRTALIFAKIVGRGHDVIIHTGLGTLKLIASTVMAIYSIPAAAFGYIPTHHKVAKEASRHFGLAAFFIADVFISLTNTIHKYPQHLVDKIQKILEIENICEEVDVEFDKALKEAKQMSTGPTSEKIIELTARIEELTTENNKLIAKNNQLRKNQNLLKEELNGLSRFCSAQEKTIKSYRRLDHLNLRQLDENSLINACDQLKNKISDFN